MVISAYSKCFVFFLAVFSVKFSKFVFCGVVFVLVIASTSSILLFERSSAVFYFLIKK